MEQTGYHVGSRTRSEGGYVAVVPAFPGCYSQGESAEDTLSNAREAILLTIKELRQRGTRFQTPGASSYTAWP